MSTWLVSGRAATAPADPGWLALIIQHDADGKPVEVSPGQTSIVAVDVTSWAVGVMILPVSLDGVLARIPCRPAPFPVQTEQQIQLVPLDVHGNRLDQRKGFLGLSVPGEDPAAALERLSPKGPDAPERPSAADAGP